MPALFLLAVLVVAAPALAQSGKPVRITADSFVIDDRGGEAVFSGAVVVSREGLTVKADKVTVSYGSGGPEDIRRFVATGRVAVSTAGQEATGGRAEFDPRSQRLRLTENVKVVNSAGTVSASELVVDLKANRTTFSGTGGGRVTGVFTPQ
jgi:lipopolysaccharide export system protein LptA